MEDMLKLAPEFKEGSPWDEGGNTEIVQILISYDKSTIKSIRFVYAKKPSGVLLSQVYGEPTGCNFNSVVLDYPSEILTSVSGMYESNYRYHGLGSITFGTNKRKYGPFGVPPNTKNWNFNYEFGERDFGGFHGTIYDSRVFSIGVYVKSIQPLNSTTNKPVAKKEY